MRRRLNPIRAAFTLVELLIVIAIFVLLLAIGVPAFSSMLYSSEQSMADNALRVAMGAGRDAAIRAGPGRDGAVVFTYSDERIAMVPIVEVGVFADEDPAGSGTGARGETVSREVFAPVAGFEPVRLPKGWMVRGFAAPGMIDQPGSGVGLWYEANTDRDYPYTQGNWVFPETDFYDTSVGGAGQHRQTFMVRFEGGTGVLKNDPSAVLVIYPGGDKPFRATTAPWSDYRADEEPDGARFVARVQSAGPSAAPNGLTMLDRWRLLGDRSGDTILTKAVCELALYNEKKLAAAPGIVALGMRVDPVTGCLYRYIEPPAPRHPAFVQNSAPNQVASAINSWIEGSVESDCRVFTVQRYLGTLQEVTGTRNAGGVTP